MRELKILAVLVGFTLFTYWGIEPLAHQIMHPHVSDSDFKFSDLKDRETALALIAKGDAVAGKESFTNNCSSCHNAKKDGIDIISDADLIAGNGLLPPDLSNAVSMYDEAFLFSFIKDPAKAGFTSIFELHKKEELAKQIQETPSKEGNLKKSHEKAVNAYGDKMASTFIKMPAFNYLPDEEIGNIVAYLKSIATPIENLSDKDVAVAACARCHSINYDKVQLQGNLPEIVKYLGSTPPDLSQMIRSKGADDLHKFINDPQKLLLGTGMPRVGLNEAGQAKVVNYLQQVGDPNVEARKEIGSYFIVFMLIFTFFAYAWKKNEFKEVGK